MTNRGRVAIFFTGGTITMKPRSDAPGVAPGGEFDRLIEELHLPETSVGLRPVVWGDRPSPHMTPLLMFELAKDVNRVLADPTMLGAVVLHGTDLLVESAFMADLVIESNKPVVYTGSMRFYSELGYDGIRNLLGGIKACLLPLPPEVGVVLLMTDRLFSAREAVKINSLNVDAFEAPGSGPVGYVAGETILLTRRPHEHSIPIKAGQIETNVAMLACYPGMDAALVDYFRAQGVVGLVVEGFGAGNVPPGVVPGLGRLIQDNIPVVLTTRCVDGGVWPMYGYPGGGAELERMGVILGGRLSAHKAQILLMVALGTTRDPDQIRRVFAQGHLGPSFSGNLIPNNE
jgi:L-asparaginase